MFGRSRTCNSQTTRSYATNDDFRHLFATESSSLLLLSLRLTANVERAAECLTLAIRDCYQSNAISKLFARVWARRMVIRNAIHMAQHPNGYEDDHFEQVDLQFGEEEQSSTILCLPKFDRLAFVICVLERLSVPDCALLLRSTPKDVNEAIVRALDRITSGRSSCQRCSDNQGSLHSSEKLSSLGC